ncbi:hypothetical protein [Lacibacter sediminis]|uniref:DUF4595 domain-containing protein n=1 Tax=Lacibacter sediminis TaxID=2760713 RepID=A0A7G5XIG1_9BACT|nr:hypothetical protein [Lacibacter sediminis]QNA45264.1 hypothetical protein H4075_03415 [Lacibacter sediminis]
MKKIITVILCSSLVLMSCKKEKTIVEPATKTVFKKVKELAIYANGVLDRNEVYAYDAEGRISSVTSLKNSLLFEYPTKNELKIIAKSKATGEVIWTQTAKLNSKGAITESEKRNPAGIVTETWNYSYDVNGYMVSYKYTTPLYDDDVQECFFVFEKGNVVAAKLYRNGILQQNETYEYDLNELSMMPHTAMSSWVSETLYGIPNKNPRKTYKVAKPDDGTITFHTVYTRTFNNNSNSLEEKVAYVLTGANALRKYTF